MNGQSRARNLFDAFLSGGEATIDKFIQEQTSEELFIDYKRAANDGNDSKLHQNDRENFARAISGFGNSEGGVIVWGVDCRNDPQRGDVPSTKHAIKNANRFLSYLESATSGCVLPAHDGVRHHLIEQQATTDGFVVTFVPKSMFAPHQCIVGKYKDRYYMRVGSNFELVSHGLLAGMFGRQPTPNVFHTWGCGGAMSPDSYAPLVTTRPTSTAYVWLNFTIRNHGVSMANDLYANLEIALPGVNCECEFDAVDPKWAMSESPAGWHCISEAGYRLAPASMASVFKITIYLNPPFTSPLWYEISFGCHASPVHRILTTVPDVAVKEAYDKFIASNRGKEAGKSFAIATLDLEKKPDYAVNVHY